jgi:translation initiation factor IF-1
MMTPKGKGSITPHKGGRTENLHVRISHGDKVILENEAKQLTISVADLIAKLAERIRKGMHLD